MQQAARSKLIAYDKVLGTVNPADILTKHLAVDLRERHAARCALEFLDGRPEIAPQVCADELGSIEVQTEIVMVARVPARGFAARRAAGKGVGDPPGLCPQQRMAIRSGVSEQLRISWADLNDE